MKRATLKSRPGWHVRLDPEALTPDPTYGKAAPAGDSIDYLADVFPWELVSCDPLGPAAEAWGARLDGDHCPGELKLGPTSTGRVDLIVDFGTEVEGCLELEIELPGRATLMSQCGEFLMEVEGCFQSEHPRAEEFVHFPAAGVYSVKRGPRGFRYVRLLFHDIHKPLTVKSMKARGQFVFRHRKGDFRCSDPRFQRAWQSSLYTARLCTRPDTFWDGIKRDRAGWFGDARIIKDAVDAVYHDPRPSRKMLASLPTDQWVNGIPVYSFDAIAMLSQHILAFGRDDSCQAEAYARVRDFLAWVAATQMDDDGFITRDASLSFFGDIGFLDWSRMPVGGRFEELSWLQCKHVAGLRTAAQIARWLGCTDDANQWEARAKRIAQRTIDVFWRPGAGFVHTLNHVGDVTNPHVPGWGGHYQRTYVDNVRLGESGASRQCNALAVWAGIPDRRMQQAIVEQVFRNPKVEPVITAYFLYYEQMARAACGDKAGAITAMSDYVADLLEDRDAATVIEMHDPRVKDFRKFCNHFEVTWDWPLSYCHGWGAGLVPLSQRHLMGLSPAAPGWSELAIEPPATAGMAFEASIPTSHGIVEVSRAEPGGPVRYRVPSGINVVTAPVSGVVVEKA